MKLVLNKTYGAFHLSDTALCRIAHLKGKNIYPQEVEGYTCYYEDPDFNESTYWDPYTWDRTDPDLVRAVEELGQLAGEGLVVRNIDSGQLYRICEYDGKEWLEFPSDINWEIAT